MKNKKMQEIRHTFLNIIKWLGIILLFLILSPILILAYLMLPFIVIVTWIITNDSFIVTWDKTLESLYNDLPLIHTSQQSRVKK